MNMKSYTTPNCDCGAELRRGWGKICSRCGCLNCSGCSDKINGKWVGKCCQDKLELETHANIRRTYYDPKETS